MHEAGCSGLVHWDDREGWDGERSGREGQDGEHMYTMKYYSAIEKNAFESILMRWMKLEPIIQSNVSQKGKPQYSILMHIYGIWKDA